MTTSQPSVVNRRRGLLTLIGPGLLVAATGVGAGDLATGAFSGAKLGVAVLWAVVLGAAVKYVLNEGLARWQLATGTTVLEGVARHFGRVAIGLFLLYLMVWSFFVGSALMSACGVAAHAIAPLGEAADDKVLYGVLHSAVAVVMVWLGGYRLFEKMMSVCIAVMFLTVVASAIAVRPDWGDVLTGLVLPRIPEADEVGAGLRWTVALMGGVGGTVTVLCYGYWIREEGRAGLEELRTCRMDLLTGYAMTALFGIGMVILGSRLNIDGATGAKLVVLLGDRLAESLGQAGSAARIAFLTGAWGAVFSSMLGVWQSVPYLFADSLALLRGEAPEDARRSLDTSSPVYRAALLAIAIIPASGLLVSFEKVQLAYGIVGAAFMPILATALSFLNGSVKRIGTAGRNSVAVTLTLIAVIAFFCWYGYYDIRKAIEDSREKPAPAASERGTNEPDRLSPDNRG
ncbi:iron transporter [bacterium]|nr:iron transporter [bacterium]